MIIPFFVLKKIITNGNYSGATCISIRIKRDLMTTLERNGVLDMQMTVITVQGKFNSTIKERMQMTLNLFSIEQ